MKHELSVFCLLFAGALLRHRLFGIGIDDFSTLTQSREWNGLTWIFMALFGQFCRLTDWKH
jgi:hypothetical protein